MRWTSDLARPVPIVAALVLATNDHVLKGHAPGWLTGKLSDVTGLFVATILAISIVRGVARYCGWREEVPRDGRAAAAAALGLGLGFVALKLWPGFNREVAAVWGPNALDPSDLFALPAIALAWLWLADRERTPGRAPRRFLGGLATATVALACIATPAPPPAPRRPVAAWQVGEPGSEAPWAREVPVRRASYELACGDAKAWVSKSGKTGFGLTIEVASRTAEPCDVAIASARVRFADGAVVPGTEIAVTQPRPDRIARARSERGSRPVPPPSEPLRYHYVAFAFDNNARWNAGDRIASIDLELDSTNRRWTWTLPASEGFLVPRLPR